MKSIFLILLFSLHVKLIGQKQFLTLDDAIMGQWSKFAPEKLNNLQWIPNSTHFSHIEKEMLIIENEDGKLTELKLSQLNNHLKQDTLKSFPRIDWINKKSFRFIHQNKICIYDFEEDKIIIFLTFNETFKNLEFSENAMALAYTIDNNLFILDDKGKNHIITNDKNKNIINGQAVHRYEFGISKGTFWSNDGKQIAFYKKDESMVTDYPLVNNNARIAEVNIIKYPMAGMKTHQVKLGIYNLKTGKTIYVKTGEPKEQYLTNIAWGPENKFIYIAVLNRDQNHMKLNKYDVKTGNFISTLFEEQDPNYVQPLHPMIFLNNNPNEFIWRSERDGYDHFYRYNTNGKLLNQVTKGKWVIKEFIGFSENEIVVTATNNNGLETCIYKSPLKSNKSKLVSKKPGVHKAQLSHNGNLILDSYNNLNNPGSIDLINLSGKKIRNLLQSKDPFENIKIGKTELFTIKTEDKSILNCRIIKPANFDTNKTYPSLIYVYNGPGVQLIYNSHLAGASLWMHYLANEYNYVIFSLDGRGSENRGRDFEQAIFRNLGEIEMQDQIIGYNYLKSLEYINPLRIAIHGWSYGGFMTTNLLCSYPNLFTCGVAGGPVIDWKFYEVMYTERYMDTPLSNPEGYNNANLILKAKNLKDNLLMIHGTQDDVVVWQHSLSFVEECVSSGIQIDYFPYPGHAHNIRGKDRIHLMRKIINYLIKHNE